MALKVLSCDEVAPTQKDDMEEDEAAAQAESNSQADTGDVRMTEAKRSSLEGKAEGATPDKKRANKQKEKSHDSCTNFEGFWFCDLGGDGDCAYRSLAVACALQDSRDVTESINASKKLGATLRAQVRSHCLTSPNMNMSNVISNPTRGGSKNLRMDRYRSPMNNIEPWVSATARSNRWIDGPCLSTAATRLSRNIAVWKWQGEPGHESWVKQIVIPPLPGHAKNIPQANSFPPLPLFLKAGHYITIKPSDSPFPMHWHDNPAQTCWDAGDNRVAAAPKTMPKRKLQNPKIQQWSSTSWLPPSSTSSVKYAVDSRDGKTNQSHAASYKSWLPASSSASHKQVDKQCLPKSNWTKVVHRKNRNASQLHF